MKDAWMGSVAAQDKYNPVEGDFQAGIRATPWFSEFTKHYGEEPNLEDPNYDYRAAWKAGARPDVRDPGDNLLHWSSQFKGENHPNRYVDGVDTLTGASVRPDWAPGAIAAQDQYRPLGNDPWTNTMRGTVPAPGQGFEPVQQSPVLYQTKAGPITEADISGAIGIGMGVSGGGLKTDIVKAPGIKAYHSSPHDFDKFDLAKIGTGEGAQVYGHGLYFAENPAVSGQGGQYWNQFTNKFSGPEYETAQLLKLSNFDRDKAIAKNLSDLQYWEKTARSSDNPVVRQELEKAQRQHELLTSGKPVGPRTYEVNIKADPAHMLDWDKPLREQVVAETVRSLVPRDLRKSFDANVDKGAITGANVYNNWVPNQSFVVRPSVNAPYAPTGAKSIEEAIQLAGGNPSLVRTINNPSRDIGSQRLKEAGIPGIKYLDQGSRNVTPTIERMHRELSGYRERGNKSAVAALEQQIVDAQKAALSSNYVIFDPSIIDIVKKYGIAGAAPAGMGALAAQDAYQAER